MLSVDISKKCHTKKHSEIRENINFCKNLDKTPTETFKIIKLARREPDGSRALALKWYNRVLDRRTLLDDREGSGWKLERLVINLMAYM